MKRKLTGAILFSASAASPAFAQWTLTTLVMFNGTNGEAPECTLVADASGNLYGTTSGGGTGLDGTVFEIAANTHTLTTLVNFNGTDGAVPAAGLVADASGNLYGTTSDGGTGAPYADGTVFEVAAGTRVLTTMVNFIGHSGPGGPFNPSSALIVDPAGDLCGTTTAGGSANDGTVFEVAVGSNTPTTLYSFTNGADGLAPQGRLLEDANGNLYGIAQVNGGNGNAGTVFELSPNPNPNLPPIFSTLATFNNNGTDGVQPQAGLIMDAHGNLYGTTKEGGANGTGNNVSGTVFEVAAGTHALTTLHSFSGSDGSGPTGDLLLDAQGNLYGTTTRDNVVGSGPGTVFEIAAGTHDLTTLYSFNYSDGSYPTAGLIMDANGNLYGTTEYGGQGPGGGGGIFGGDGTVFELSPNPATLAWYDAGGSGDGRTWDTASNQNWNNAGTPAVFHAGDNVTFNDSNANNYTVILNTTVGPGSVTVNNSAGNYTISGSGSIAGTGSVTKSGSDNLTLDTVNTYTGGTNVSAGTLVVGVNGALPTGAVNITGGTLQLAASTGLAQMTSLSITSNGALDVANNHIIVDYGSGPDPIASIAAMLASGYAGGAWNGPGIDSSIAAATPGYGLGYADSADPGNPAGLSSGQIEIKYTLLGDVDLNGIVNGVDFGILAANFNKGVSRWDQGDFNYDNIVNGIDFAELAANFNKGASGAADGGSALSDPALVAFAEANGLMADVPEPVGVGVLMVGAVGVLGRRRRGWKSG
jgi:autotransporter-associated beta strand protein/uncharacterized repeat protein (TIGR03803 family)